MKRRAPAKVPEHSERHQRRSNHNGHDLPNAGQVYLSRRPLPVDELAAATANYNQIQDDRERLPGLEHARDARHLARIVHHLGNVREQASLVRHVAARADGGLNQAGGEPGPGAERDLQRVRRNEQCRRRDQGLPALRRVVDEGADERHQYRAAQPRHRRDEGDR